MRIPKPTTVDFEGLPIQPRPHYPPRPVGVSIKPWGKKSRYYAWGHPSANNCTESEAKAALQTVWDSGVSILCHNGKFDLDCAEVFFGLPYPAWDKVEETMFLAYLDDPHQTQLGLKPLGERYLGMAPEERDAVVEWLMANQPPAALALASEMAGKPIAKLSRSRQSKAYAGAFVAFAPGDITGAYANGDSDRTEALFKKLWVAAKERDMLGAYDRERQLCPILLAMERRGVRVDVERLRADVKLYRDAMVRTETWVRKRLGVGPDVKLIGQQLVEAMAAVGKVDVPKLGITPKDGKPRTDGAAFKAAVSDRVLCAVLQYRSQLHTCLGTFMENWLATAEASGGYIHTSWHQVRGTEKNGTRTGRLSATPNLQNIPTEFDPIFHHEQAGLPKIPAALGVLPPLPQVRSYIIPYKDGHVLVGRDYQGQEMRAFAHFEEADMYEAFKADPWMDPHARAATLLSTLMGRSVDRKKVAKPTGFTIIYGGGAPILASRLGISLAEAKTLKENYLKVVPGLKALDRELKDMARARTPFRTWGGREYHVEPSKIIDGKLREFSYKCLNMLIQGSSADCTKHAIVSFMAANPPKDWLLMLQVHDEIVLSVPKKDMARAQEALRVAMLSARFDVPMLSEGEYSECNWQDMKPYDVAGKVVAEGFPGVAMNNTTLQTKQTPRRRRQGKPIVETKLVPVENFYATGQPFPYSDPHWEKP